MKAGGRGLLRGIPTAGRCPADMKSHGCDRVRSGRMWRRAGGHTEPTKGHCTCAKRIRDTGTLGTRWRHAETRGDMQGHTLGTHGCAAPQRQQEERKRLQVAVTTRRLEEREERTVPHHEPN